MFWDVFHKNVYGKCIIFTENTILNARVFSKKRYL